MSFFLEKKIFIHLVIALVITVLLNSCGSENISERINDDFTEKQFDAKKMKAIIPDGFGKTPIFYDDFTSTSLDLSKWTHRSLGIRNNCINTDRSVSVNNGILKITTFSENSSGVIKNYCGMISTQNSFLNTYGYWETSIRLNRVEGVQNAFWIQSPTMGSDVSNPQKSGLEFDVFEHLAEAQSNEYDHAIHWNGYQTDHKSWVVKRTNNILTDGKFHTFGFSWTPSGYKFYIDGVEQNNLSGLNNVPISIAKEYIILSSEVPRNYPSIGFGDINISKAIFEIDYVKVYPYQGQ